MALAVASAAAQAFGGSIVDVGFVEKALARRAIVWDVRPAGPYDLGHIPGAVNLGSVETAILEETTHRFLPLETIAGRLGEAGIDLQREIVVYGAAGSAWPYFAQYTLLYLGARRVHVFHSGIEGWRAARRRLSTDTPAPRPVKVRPVPNPGLVATTEEVAARVGDPGVQFVDTRRRGEYDGTERETLHGGHIPGAHHIPYNEQLEDPRAPHRRAMLPSADASGLALKSVPSLRRLYAALDPAQETIVYCHTGIRAAMTATVLARMGFRRVRLYHASWREYGNRPDAAVEK